MTRSRNVLSNIQRQHLEDRGLVRLEGVVPRAACEAMAEHIWRDLAHREGVRRGDPSTWTVERPWGFQALRNSGALNAMATPAFRQLADELMGEGGWEEPKAFGQPLVCFPGEGPWRLPAKVWHLDLPGGPDAFSTRLGRLFLVLTPLRPRGGGTLVATGSHRLVARMTDAPGHRQSSAAARKRLMDYSWFRDLLTGDPAGPGRAARFMDVATDVDGVPCQVLEMTGEPGDVYLMHPASLHTLSPNVLDQPRLVLTQTLVPKG